MVDRLLKEDGDLLLQESGDAIVLEWLPAVTIAVTLDGTRAGSLTNDYLLTLTLTKDGAAYQPVSARPWESD